MPIIFEIKHYPSLVNSELKKPNNLALSLLTGNLSQYKLWQKLKKVNYWWIEVDSNNFSLNRKIGFDISRTPLNRFVDIKLQYDFKNNQTIQKIDSTLFNNMWSLSNKKDFKQFKRIYNEYLQLWKYSEVLEAPLFPIIIIDMENKSDIEIINSLDDLVHRADYLEYEWDETERLIDSKGNIYKTKYYNFGHPVGLVIPSMIEKKINSTKLTEILSVSKIKFELKA